MCEIYPGEFEAMEHNGRMDAIVDDLRDCQTCKHSINHKCAGTETCHECMWDSKYVRSDMLSAEEIDKLLRALAEGEDDVDFEREKREKILEESEEVEREYDTMYYPQVDGITPTVVAESCDDCISRQAVFDLMRSLTRWCVRSEDGKFNNVGLLYDDVMFGIDKLPPVTPKPKTGEWKKIVTAKDGYNETWHYECSECQHRSSMFGDDKFCPNCGACMKDCRTLDEFIEDSKESEE